MSSFPTVTVNIEGEFIDSFIYSGSLFLVGMDGLLKTYQWKDIVNHILKSVPKTHYHLIRSLLMDSRYLLVDGAHNNLENDLTFSVNVDSECLSKFQGSSINLENLPTDLNIFSNKPRCKLCDEFITNCLIFES